MTSLSHLLSCLYHDSDLGEAPSVGFMCAHVRAGPNMHIHSVCVCVCACEAKPKSI